SPGAIVWGGCSFSWRAFCRTIGQSRCARSRSRKTWRTCWSRMATGELSAMDRLIFEAKHPAEVCRHNEQLKMDGFSVHRVGDKGTFNVKTWISNDGDSYSLSTQGGKVTPSGSNHGIY